MLALRQTFLPDGKLNLTGAHANPFAGQWLKGLCKYHGFTEVCSYHVYIHMYVCIYIYTSTYPHVHTGCILTAQRACARSFFLGDWTSYRL